MAVPGKNPYHTPTFLFQLSVPTMGKPLQDLSGLDTSPQVRLRATRALLMLHGMTPAPLTFPRSDFG